MKTFSGNYRSHLEKETEYTAPKVVKQLIEKDLDH